MKKVSKVRIYFDLDGVEYVLDVPDERLQDAKILSVLITGVDAGGVPFTSLSGYLSLSSVVATMGSLVSYLRSTGVDEKRIAEAVMAAIESSRGWESPDIHGVS
jgi:hypothetical protein